jgi:cytochrome P450
MSKYNQPCWNDHDRREKGRKSTSLVVRQLKQPKSRRVECSPYVPFCYIFQVLLIYHHSLVKSNLSNSTNKLSDEEILDECSSLLFNGTDTVSVALTWCLHLLSLHPTVQTRLRDELRDATVCHNADGNSSDSSADSGFHDCTSSACACRRKTLWDKIEGLPYLEAVIRETLRFCPPVHGTIRVAMADTYVPVSRPITLSTGEIIHKDECLEIRKGSYVHIPIESLNYSEDLWGSDALDFK